MAAREDETDGPQEARQQTAVVLSGGLASAQSGVGAPYVSAIGRGGVATDLIATAERHGVPVEHDPVLAAVLSTFHVGQAIPPELYQAIAELLVFLYDLDAQVESEV